MHIRDDRAYQLCKELYPLILESDQFIAEMDLDLKPASIQTQAYNIHQYLDRKHYEKLKAQLLKSFGIDIDFFATLHPLMILSVISTSVLEAEHQISLDEHLWQYAKENHKPTSGLESYEEQLNILQSIDAGSIYKQLQEIGRKPWTMRKNADKGLDLYIQQNIHQLYRLSKSSMQNLRKKVIYDRNFRMVSVIDHLDYSMKYFITVGAGHLSGKFGLISLLRKSGWTVRSVPLITN